EGQSAQPELLPGVLQDGPENPAGTVRLPGDTAVFLPAGRAAADYQAAAEEALTEGDLPLSYHEVIRRYFPRPAPLGLSPRRRPPGARGTGRAARPPASGQARAPPPR